MFLTHGVSFNRFLFISHLPIINECCSCCCCYCHCVRHNDDSYSMAQIFFTMKSINVYSLSHKHQSIKKSKTMYTYSPCTLKCHWLPESLTACLSVCLSIYVSKWMCVWAEHSHTHILKGLEIQNFNQFPIIIESIHNKQTNIYAHTQTHISIASSVRILPHIHTGGQYHFHFGKLHFINDERLKDKNENEWERVKMEWCQKRETTHIPSIANNSNKI